MVGIIRRSVLRRPAQGQGVPHADGPLSVGADLRVRPPVLGAHIGAPLHGGGGSFRSTWLPPSRGKLSAERLTDEGAHGDDGQFCPLPPHPSFAPQMPPSPLWGEGFAGGHMGPPLRKFRTVIVRRGGPACPPTRPGRTHRCAPTWRRGQLPPYKASPFQGEAVERSETDEGAHGDNGQFCPLSPHPAFAPQMPAFPREREGRPVEKPVRC